MPSRTDRATSVRHFVVFTAMLMSIILYLDRFCVSFAVDYIREDLQLTQQQISWFLSAFFWSYALAQVPAGWFSDRYGARIMLAVYVISWSFFTAMIGAAESFFVLLAARLACGLGQAGAYPTSASVVSKWVPFANRGTASSIIAFGGRIGGAVAPVLTAVLIVSFVPLTVDSHLQQRDILDAGGVCRVLSEDVGSDEPSAPAHIRTLLPNKTQETLHPFDEQRRLIDELERQSEQEPARSEELSKTLEQVRKKLDALTITAAQQDELRTALNVLIDDGNIYDERSFNSVKLSRQTIATLKRRADGETLPADEQQRNDRLLLESVFPGAISKIYTGGWRPVMYVYGASGIFVAALIWFVFRSRPEEHHWANQAERELIAEGRPAHAPSPHGKAGKVPLWELIKSRSMFFVCLVQFGTNVGWLFVVTWMPRYLLEVHQVPILERATMTMTPMLIGVAGMLLGGRLTDVLAHRIGLRWGRRLPMMATRFLAAAGYAGCIWFSTFDVGTGLNRPWCYVAALSLVAAATDMGTGAVWAFKQDVGGRYVGSILGWGNMWGNLGAAVSPLIYNHFLGETPAIDDWNRMFGVCCAAFVMAGFCAFGIDATIPIAPPDEEAV